MHEWRKGVGRAVLFVGRRGVVFFAVCAVTALLLAVIEYALAIFLMVFLYTLRFIDPSQLPAWLPFDVRNVTPGTVWVTLLAIGLIQAVCFVVHYQSKSLFAEGTHARMQMALAYKVLIVRDTPFMALSEMNLYTGEIFPKATEFMFYFTQAVAAIIQALTVSVGMFLLAPGEAGVGLAGLGVMGCLVLRLNRVTNRVSARVPEAQAELERTKVRVARNRLLIRIFGLQEAEYANWLRSSFSYFRHNTLAYLFGNLGGALMPVLGIVLIAAIVLANYRFFHTPVVSLLGFLYLFYRLQQMVANGSMLIGGLFTYQPQVARAMELVLSLSREELRAAVRPERGFRMARRALDISPWRSWPMGRAHGDRSASLPPPRISLERVTFSWPRVEAPVLRNVSIEVEAGTQLAIVGPNGSGKSTLLGIMLGALRPSSGRARIGGQDSDAYVASHASSIAYVGPEPYLIHGSVRENLTYGVGRDCAEDEIWDTLSKVGLDGFFQGLPGGLAYAIQENGEGLSSGQKQRLAMARGFLRRPSLFVMDEPSANLDAESEACVLEVLRALKSRCTVVVVSHRPGMLKDADRTIRIDELSGGE